MTSRYRTVFRCLCASIALWAPLAYGAAMCPLKGLAAEPATSAQCLFFSGTGAYRDKNFALAATHWKALIALRSLTGADKELQVAAYNNLGFLYFFGNGITLNKAAAIDYWRYASLAGDIESGYHLCHAYADREEPTFNRKLGRKYCAQALRQYRSLKQHDDDTRTIVSQLMSYSAKVNGSSD